jgi:hypothetical protein
MQQVLWQPKPAAESLAETLQSYYTAPAAKGVRSGTYTRAA